MDNSLLRVAVVGVGYIGLPVALLAARAGHHVTAYDTDPRRVAQLQAGGSPLTDIPAAEIRAATASGRFHPTGDPQDLDGFDVALICVPTPTAGQRPDLTGVQAAAKTVAAHLRPGTMVVLESSTYPGTTEDVVVPILQSHGLRAGGDFHLGYSPERIDPGMGLDRMRAVPKIVAGIDAASATRIAEFYRGLVETVVGAPDIRTAELAKLIENVFRLVNVSLVNELAQHATALGANIWDSLALAGTKGFGFMGFHPGPGAGGHCLPADTRYLAWAIRVASGRPADLLETATQVNDAMPAYIADRVAAGITHRGGPPITQARIVAVGITYKAGIPDVRESAALAVAYDLGRRGADVVLVDPVARGVPAVRPQLTHDLAATATAVVLLVAHPGLDLAALDSAAYVFDACRAAPAAPNVETL